MLLFLHNVFYLLRVFNEQVRLFYMENLLTTTIKMQPLLILNN